jgi:hypothetical protein
MSTPSEKLRELADFIETKEKQFDYKHWSNDCGTVRCAGGWACELWPDELCLNEYQEPELVADRSVYTTKALSKAIGISFFDACGMFVPEWRSTLLDKDSPRERASASEVARWIRRHADALEAQP